MSKKKKSYKPEEVGMLFEHINDKISVVAEQHLTTDKKIENLNKKVDGMAKDIGKIKVNVNVLNETVGEIKEDVGIIKLDIEFIKNDLKNKVARDEFVALERRVSLLESRR